MFRRRKTEYPMTDFRHPNNRVMFSIGAGHNGEALIYMHTLDGSFSLLWHSQRKYPTASDAFIAADVVLHSRMKALFEGVEDPKSLAEQRESWNA